MGFGLVDFPPLILQRPLIIAGLLQKADRLAGVVALMKFFTNGEWVCYSLYGGAHPDIVKEVEIPSGALAV